MLGKNYSQGSQVSVMRKEQNTFFIELPGQIFIETSNGLWRLGFT